jgi:aspartyl protease family protein
VLSAETAMALGIRPESLNYRIPVSTANGRGLAAPITIERLAVGPIQVQTLPAMVARPGMLEGNLLGQTFLERLESYEVRGKRLVLRAAKS